MTTIPACPSFRTDLEVLAQAAPGKPDRHIIREPRSDTVHEFTGKEAFLLGTMDGHNDLETIRTRFQEQFGFSMSKQQLNAFVFQLQDARLLASSSQTAEPTQWQRMKRLPFPTSRQLSRMAAWCRWCFGWPGRILFWLITVSTVGLLVGHWDEIYYSVVNLILGIEMVGEKGFLSVQGYFRIFVAVVIIPFITAMAKSVACRHYGHRVPENRYLWYMRCIPRCATDVTSLARIDSKRDRYRVARAGLSTSIVLFGLALLFYDLLSRVNVARDVAFSIALGTAISMLLNAIPVGSQDGGLLFSLWKEVINLRSRAVKLFRSCIFFQPQPEPLLPGEHRFFFWYGLAADLYSVLINTAMLTLAGYLLIHWLEGLGAVLFAAIVFLRFEEDLRRMVRSLPGMSWLSKRVLGNQGLKKWVLRPLFLLILIILFLIPYPQEISGEFRVQPADKREIRTEVQSWIENILVDEGALVEKGQPLVQLAQRQIKREYDSTAAALEREQANLQKLNQGARPEEIAVAQQKVGLAKTGYEHSERALTRAKDLYDKKHISDQDYDTALKQRDIDRDTLELAKRELELIESGVRDEDINAQNAVVKQLEGELVHLQDSLDLTTIASPISGSITSLQLAGKVGQQVNIGDVVAIVENNQQALVRIAMPEEYAGVVKVGADVKIKPWAYANKVLHGKVKTITSVVIDRSEDILKQASIEQEGGMVRNLSQPEDQVVIVLAELSNEDGLLKSEMTGYAKIEGDIKPLGLVLLDPVIRFFRVRVWSWIP